MTGTDLHMGYMGYIPVILEPPCIYSIIYCRNPHDMQNSSYETVLYLFNTRWRELDTWWSLSSTLLTFPCL